MMSRRWGWLAIAVGMVACERSTESSHASKSAVSRGPRAPSDGAGELGQIDYASQGGLAGGGHGTKLHIEPGGAATRSKRLGATVSFTLDARGLEDLRQKVVAAQIATLRSYHFAYDDFYDRVAVQLDGTRYELQIGESGEIPDRLLDVVNALRALSGTPLRTRIRR